MTITFDSPLLPQNKKLLILAEDASHHFGKEALGLGDLIRVLTVVPGLMASEVMWVSPTKLFPLVKDVAFITHLFASEQLPQALRNADWVLNLTHEPLVTEKPQINIFDLIIGEGTLKKKADHLPVLLQQALGVPKRAAMPLAPADGSSSIDFGFNLHVPDSWAIKRLPMTTWHSLEELLKPYSVSWQPENAGLESYIEWVKNCRVLISVVGLGCHLAELYGKRLLMLAGPTDYPEAHEYTYGKVLYPPSKCDYRPCFLQQGKDNCGCMPAYEASAIAAAAKEMRQQ